jgi:hypothetical protein
MIPALIQREHVDRAMDEIDRTGVPPGRDSRKFFISRNEKRYPPKYVISCHRTKGVWCNRQTGENVQAEVLGWRAWQEL